MNVLWGGTDIVAIEGGDSVVLSEVIDHFLKKSMGFVFRACRSFLRWGRK